MSVVETTAFPIPCLRCGAAMVEELPNALHGDLCVRCGFCGAREPLARDAAERVRLLRLRLIQLRGAERAAEAPALRVQQVLDSHVWAVSIVVAILPGAAWIASEADEWSEAFRRARAAATLDAAISLVETIAPPLVPAALAVGLAVGFLAMRRAFHRAVRPALLARPPRVAGEAPRCRACGAPLSGAAHAASAECLYCGARSFFGDELTERRAELLAAEADEHRRRAQGWIREFGEHGAPARAFCIGGAAGAVAAFIVAVLSTVLVVLAP